MINEVSVGQEQNKKSWNLYILGGVILLLFCAWYVMRVKGVGLYYRVSHDEYAVQEISDYNFIVQEYGIHFKGFNKVSLYPLRSNIQTEVRTVFYDGSVGEVSVMSSVLYPTSDNDRIKLHGWLWGNTDKLDAAVTMVSRNSVHLASSTITGRESLTHKRAEFADLVSGQVRDGLYLGSKKIVNVGELEVYKVEFLKDTFGRYVVDIKSPFREYGVEVGSIVIGITYDTIEEMKKDILRKALEGSAREEKIHDDGV